MTATNKQYSYLRVTVIRINVHPTGENPTNTSHAFHAQLAYGSRPYISHVVHVLQHFMSRWQIWTDLTAPEKKGSWQNPQHVGWSIRESVPNFSPKPTNEAVGLSQASIDGKPLDLLDPYTSMRSVRWILVRRVNPSVVNRHTRGLQTWWCQLSTYHSSTFLTSGLHFPLKGPARSQVIQNLLKIIRFKF
jgi:hypothetical protein